MSWEITSSSLTPALTRRWASLSTSPTGRLTSLPRIDGMMQKLQLWLQPSEIFR
ncbi:hypothetical protein D9M69_618480 [compost metagenome]